MCETVALSSPTASIIVGESDPKPLETSPQHSLRRTLAAQLPLAEPTHSQKKMFHANKQCALQGSEGTPSISDSIRARSFRSAARNKSSGLVPALNLNALAVDHGSSESFENCHPAAFKRHCGSNAESDLFKAAFMGSISGSDIPPDISVRSAGRVLPERVFDGVNPNTSKARPQCSSLGADLVPQGHQTVTATPQLKRATTLIVPGLEDSAPETTREQKAGNLLSAKVACGSCPWIPVGQTFEPPAAARRDVNAAALPLSRTYATHCPGPLTQVSARYGRHIGTQEARTHHVQLSSVPGGLRTAQWSRRYVSPGNPIFLNLRYPLDSTLVDPPSTEYAKSFSVEKHAKALA
jgi:hypothetical protein